MLSEWKLLELEEYHRSRAEPCTVLVMGTIPKQPSSRGLAEITRLGVKSGASPHWRFCLGSATTVPELHSARNWRAGDSRTWRRKIGRYPREAWAWSSKGSLRQKSPLSWPKLDVYMPIARSPFTKSSTRKKISAKLSHHMMSNEFEENEWNKSTTYHQSYLLERKHMTKKLKTIIPAAEVWGHTLPPATKAFWQMLPIVEQTYDPIHRWEALKSGIERYSRCHDKSKRSIEPLR